METGGRRAEIDLRLKRWDEELEAIRVQLGRAPDAVHAAHGPAFAALFRQKELVRARWEAIRGVYRPDPAAVQRFEDALAGLEAARAGADALLTAALGGDGRGVPGVQPQGGRT